MVDEGQVIAYSLMLWRCILSRTALTIRGYASLNPQLGSITTKPPIPIFNQETLAEARHLLRAILREASYLPDTYALSLIHI